jgi:hypothetical protein
MSDDGRQQVAAILGRTDLAADRGVFDLFIKLLDDTQDGNGIADTDFWYTAHELPQAHPDWGSELLGHYLKNRIAIGNAKGISNPFKSVSGLVPHHLHPEDFVRKCAECTPAVFIGHVWPPVLDVIERTAHEPRDEYLRSDELWPLRHYGDTYADLDDQLLLGLESAFAGVARDQPERLAGLVVEHAETQYESVVHLLFHAFGANPARFAGDAIEFMLADDRRFTVSYSSGRYWGARQLIQAITPQASGVDLKRLSESLMDFYPAWERSVDGHSEHGFAQFCLLGGIVETVRSSRVRSRLAELQRKFGEDPGEPTGVQGGIVHSPIPSDAAEKMTGEQWRSALVRYHDERGRNPSDFLKGGAHQLSSVLEARTEADPVRFSRLAASLPDDTNPCYFEAILRGVRAGDHTVALDLTSELCLHCHALPGRPMGMWIGGPIVRHAEEPLPDELIDLLTWYATNDSSPISDRDAAGDEEAGALEQHGLNTVRGMAADSIAHLVYARNDNLERMRLAIESLVSDRVMAVRAMAARIPLMLLRHHPDDALDLFDTLTDGADDGLLASRQIQDFLRHRAAIDFTRLKSTLERMLGSVLPAVQSLGASWITLAALDNADAHALSDVCLVSSEQIRIGVARVYAANLTVARYQARCESALSRLFEDDSEEVRKAASAALTRLGNGALEKLQPLAQQFLASPAAADDDDQILLMFTTTTARVPGLALNACETILRHLGPEACDIRTRAARLAGQLSEILIRAYADSDGAADLRERALDMIDQSLRLNIYGADRALREHDRP